MYSADENEKWYHETNAQHDDQQPEERRMPPEGVSYARKQQPSRFIAEQAGRVLHQPSAHRGRAEALPRTLQGEARPVQLRRSLREQLLQVLRDELQLPRTEEPHRDVLRDKPRGLYPARPVRGGCFSRKERKDARRLCDLCVLCGLNTTGHGGRDDFSRKERKEQKE